MKAGTSAGLLEVVEKLSKFQLRQSRLLETEIT